MSGGRLATLYTCDVCNYSTIQRANIRRHVNKVCACEYSKSTVEYSLPREPSARGAQTLPEFMNANMKPWPFCGWERHVLNEIGRDTYVNILSRKIVPSLKGLFDLTWSKNNTTIPYVHHVVRCPTQRKIYWYDSRCGEVLTYPDTIPTYKELAFAFFKLYASFLIVAKEDMYGIKQPEFWRRFFNAAFDGTKKMITYDDVRGYDEWMRPLMEAIRRDIPKRGDVFPRDAALRTASPNTESSNGGQTIYIEVTGENTCLVWVCPYCRFSSPIKQTTKRHTEGCREKRDDGEVKEIYGVRVEFHSIDGKKFNDIAERVFDPERARMVCYPVVNNVDRENWALKIDDELFDWLFWFSEEAITNYPLFFENMLLRVIDAMYGRHALKMEFLGVFVQSGKIYYLSRDRDRVSGDFTIEFRLVQSTIHLFPLFFGNIIWPMVHTCMRYTGDVYTFRKKFIDESIAFDTGMTWQELANLDIESGLDFLARCPRYAQFCLKIYDLLPTTKEMAVRLNNPSYVVNIDHLGKNYGL
jgi:hypothetical protein